MNKTKQLFANLFLTLLGLGSAQASNYATNLTPGSTWLSRAVYDLHMQILWICVAIGIAVFGVMFYSIVHHRKSKGHKPAQFYHNTKVEIIWGTIPTIIIVVMGWLATGVMREMYNVEDSDMTVVVTGHQFYWEYEYLDKSNSDRSNNIHFNSELDVASKNARDDEEIDPLTVPNYLLNVNEPLVVPVKKKVRYVLTSADVIHSWWVPNFGWKKDANPGFMNEAWASVDNEPWITGDTDVCESVPKDKWAETDQQTCATLANWKNIDKRPWSSSKKSAPQDFWNSVKIAGVYRGQCTELCGAGHGFMPVVVVALKQPDYDKWVQYKTTPPCDPSKEKCDTPPKGDMTHEELVYQGSLAYNAKCEGCHGRDGGGAVGPSLKSSNKVTGDIKELAKFVITGKGTMPAFAKQLEADEIASVVTYIRDRFGNVKTDEIQPREVEQVLTELNGTSNSNNSGDADKQEGVDVNKHLSGEELVKQGETVYANNCQGCHQAAGEGLPPMFPALAGSPVVSGDIDAQINLMLNGKNSMPAFGKSLNAVDFASVLAYTRHKFGNVKEGFKQPADIQSFMAALPADAD